MTCREKLKLKLPELSADRLDEITRSYCPFEMEIDYPPGQVCRHSICSECWNTEIPEIENIKKEKDIMDPTKMTKAELLKEIEFAHNHIREMECRLERMEYYKQYEDMADELKAMHTAFMNSGFTNEQAYDLLKTMTQAAIPTALRGMGL